MATVVALGLAEVIVRAVVPVTDVIGFFWDPAVGPRHIPGQEGRFVAGRFVDTHYHFNAQGWNHPRDYQIAKVPGTRRIALVGDSFVEALHVDVGKAMFSVAERQMTRAHPSAPVEWYAFGTSGWGTTQEEEVVRKYVLDYRPELVIVFFVENDPFDSSPYIAPIEPYIATYELDDHNLLLLRPPVYWETSLLRKVVRQSALVRYFVLQKGLLQPAGPTPGRLQMRAAQVAAGVTVGDDEVAHDRQRRTWLLIEETLAAMRDECERRGAKLALAFRGVKDRIEEPLTGVPYQAGPAGEDPYCLTSRIGEMGPEQLAPMAARLGLPYLDLTGALRAKVAATQSSHCFPDDDHYSVMGHQFAGEALGEWAETLLQP